MAVTSTSDSSACTPIGRPRGAAHQASSDAASGSARVRSAPRSSLAAGWCWRRPCSRSAATTVAAMISSSHTVPGSLPVWNSARVNAPKATNSPCGMKITRVTANTSTVASASSA